MVAITKPSSRVPMVDDGKLPTATWENFFRQIGVDKPAEVAAQFEAVNQSIIDWAILGAFHD